MTRRALKSDDEEGFVRAFKDEIVDLELNYGVEVKVCVIVDARRPGITLSGEATGRADTPLEHKTAFFDYPYPSHRATRLYAALYALAVALNVQVQHLYQETTGHYLE